MSRGALIPYFKFKASLFCCPFFFEEYFIRQVRINKMINKYRMHCAKLVQNKICWHKFNRSDVNKPPLFVIDLYLFGGSVEVLLLLILRVFFGWFFLIIWFFDYLFLTPKLTKFYQIFKLLNFLEEEWIQRITTKFQEMWYFRGIIRNLLKNYNGAFCEKS